MENIRSAGLEIDFELGLQCSKDNQWKSSITIKAIVSVSQSENRKQIDLRRFTAE